MVQVYFSIYVWKCVVGKYKITNITYKVILFNFHPPEVVSRYRDPQLQVGEN